MELRRRIAAVAGLGLLSGLLLPVPAAAAAPPAENAWVSLNAYAAEVGASVRLDNLTGDVWVVWDGAAWLVYPPDVSATPGVSPKTVRSAGGVVQMRLSLLERLMPQAATGTAEAQVSSAEQGAAASTATAALSSAPPAVGAIPTTEPPPQGTPSTSVTVATPTAVPALQPAGSDAPGEATTSGPPAQASPPATSAPTPSPSSTAPSPTVASSTVPTAAATSGPAPSASTTQAVAGAPSAGTGLGLFARLATGLRHVLGAPYAWGGESPAGFDCSGLVQWAFHLLGIALPRTSWGQYAATKPAPNLVPGDLVFFQTYAPGASHVGIYLGAGRFITAGISGVTVARLSDPYWAARYLGARTAIPS